MVIHPSPSHLGCLLAADSRGCAGSRHPAWPPRQAGQSHTWAGDDTQRSTLFGVVGSKPRLRFRNLDCTCYQPQTLDQSGSFPNTSKIHTLVGSRTNTGEQVMRRHMDRHSCLQGDTWERGRDAVCVCVCACTQAEQSTHAGVRADKRTCPAGQHFFFLLTFPTNRHRALETGITQ